MFNFGGGSCDLECRGELDPDRTHEFVGTVKIIFLDPSPADYLHKVWGSAIVTLAYLLIVATVTPVIYFTLTFKLPLELNLHIASCMIGLHLLIPTAILMLDPMFGGAMHLSSSSRVCQHVLLAFFAGVCIFGGVAHLYYYAGRFRITVHAISGVVATSAVILSTVIGMMTACVSSKKRKSGNWLTRKHKQLGTFTLVLSAFTLCTGIFTSPFDLWVTWSRVLLLQYILIAFCAIYTICIMLSISWRHYVI